LGENKTMKAEEIKDMIREAIYLLGENQPDQCPNWKINVGDCNKPECKFCRIQKCIDKLEEYAQQFQSSQISEEEIVKTIESSLKSARLINIIDEDNEGFHLLDLLSGETPNISQGLKEIENIVDNIALDLYPILSRLPHEQKEQANFMQVIPQTYAEQFKMYQEMDKDKIIEMLLECHRQMGINPPKVEPIEKTDKLEVEQPEEKKEYPEEFYKWLNTNCAEMHYTFWLENIKNIKP